MKFFFSDLEKSLQISDLKIGSKMENFNSEITLKNKVSDLKSDLRNLLLNYNLCISSKTWSFLMFLQYIIILTSGQKTSEYFLKEFFF